MPMIFRMTAVILKTMPMIFKTTAMVFETQKFYFMAFNCALKFSSAVTGVGSTP